MRTSNVSSIKRAAVAAVGAGALLVSAAAPAQASAPGNGVFVGSEIPPASVTFYPPPTQMCATFNASTADPLIHNLTLAGTFHGSPGIGTAQFTGTTPYDANPQGTFTRDTNCATPAGVPGSMTINFAPYSCSGTGTYERRNMMVYTLTFTGTCNPGAIATQATFSGVQVPCPFIVGCVADPNIGAVMAGRYTQTG